MLDKVTARNTRSAEQGIGSSMFPGLALNIWAPALSSNADWNVKLNEGFATLACEWQEFVSQRLRDDLSLLEQMGRLRSPEQAWTAYVKFWQKAAEDYTREFATISRLTGELVTGSITGLQHSMQAAASELQLKAKAA